MFDCLEQFLVVTLILLFHQLIGLFEFCFIGNRIVQDRFPVVILRMSDLDALKITCPVILIGRIISDIDLFTVIMAAVPFILKSNTLISCKTINKEEIFEPLYSFIPCVNSR